MVLNNGDFFPLPSEFAPLSGPPRRVETELFCISSLNITMSTYLNILFGVSQHRSTKRTYTSEELILNAFI
jgi:hypothetical protein